MIAKIIIGALLGSSLGFLYHRFIGCASGACPIAGNPYVSIIFGLIIGILIALGK